MNEVNGEESAKVRGALKLVGRFVSVVVSVALCKSEMAMAEAWGQPACLRNSVFCSASRFMANRSGSASSGMTSS